MAKAEKPNKWAGEQGFFSANTGDIFTVTIVVLCAAIFGLLVMTQWNMSVLVSDYFASLPVEKPQVRQPDIQSKPGETGMILFPAKPPAQPKPAPKKP